MMPFLPADPAKRGRVKLLLLAAFFALPVVGGWLAYVFDWAPGDTGNYGELLAPRSVPAVALPGMDGEPLRLPDLRGRWILLTFDTGACDAYCERKLYFIRQARRALGADMNRIERVWILTDRSRPAPELAAAIAGTYVVRGESGFDAAFPAQQAVADHIYLVDPLGNLMMRFPRDPEPALIIKDLRRLLKYSRIG